MMACGRDVFDGVENCPLQAIYAERQRRFGVSSFKTIRQEQYEDVLDFLDRWANAAAKG